MNFANDVRFGLRTLRKAPGFALTAIVTMALGIGATTAIFSVCDAMMWKPVPIPHLETLAMVLERHSDDPHEYGGVTAADIADIGRQSNALDNLATWTDGLANVAGPGGEPERVMQYLVSANFFDVIGVPPALGRGFVAGENEAGRDHVVVLGDALWRRRYGADPGIVGKIIRLDDEDYVVAGVAAKKFTFPKAAELWTPSAMTPAQRADRKSRLYSAAGRLKAGITPAQLAAELDVIGSRLAAQHPDTNRLRHFMTWDAHRFLVGEYNRLYLTMLLYAVLFVLLIACVNVANLQFARSTGRMREVALRTALGASRGQIVAQLLTESVMLSLCGAALGLVIAGWGVELIRAGMPPEVEKYIVGWSLIGLDARAMFFTMIAAVASGVLAGLAPAWQSSRPNLAAVLKEGGRSSRGRGRHRLRNLLVAAEVSLAVVLLIGASLMVFGFGNLVNAATSMEPASLLTFRLALTDAKYKDPIQRRAFYNQVLERVAAIPGVRSAVGATALPYSDHSSWRGLLIEGRPADATKPIDAMYQTVTAGYFRTLHIGLRAGRLFNSHDGPDAPRVAIISQRMAERYWPGEAPPIGKRIRIEGGETATWITIVGVTSDIMHDTFDRTPRPALYVPYDQDSRLWLDIGLRTGSDPSRYGAAVAAAVRAVDPEQPVTDMHPMDTLIHNQALGLIYVAVLMGVFGVLALVLACVGVYGVMAYLVQEQTHEIGIRMALGAPRDSVLGMILWRGLATTSIGLAVGLAASFALSRLLQNLIWGIPATNAATFIGIPIALVAAAALAILIPARRATRIDPMIALRYD
jgi:putative ABC transport system permease protein